MKNKREGSRRAGSWYCYWDPISLASEGMIHSTHRTAHSCCDVMWCVPCWSRIKCTRIVGYRYILYEHANQNTTTTLCAQLCSTVLYRGPTDDSERQLLRDTTHHTPHSTAQPTAHYSSHRPLVERRGLQISPGIKGLGPWPGSESVLDPGSRSAPRAKISIKELSCGTDLEVISPERG